MLKKNLDVLVEHPNQNGNGPGRVGLSKKEMIEEPEGPEVELAGVDGHGLPATQR